MPYEGAPAPAWMSAAEVIAGKIFVPNGGGVWNRTYLAEYSVKHLNCTDGPCSAGLNSSDFPNRWHWQSSLWQSSAAEPTAGHQTGWLMFSIGSLFGFLGALLIFLAILLDKSLRKRPFMVYILFLVLTDTIFSFLCLQCFWNYLAGEWVGGSLFCDMQSWYVTFGFGGSMYMNALIGFKIRKMLTMGLAGKAFIPPSVPQVIVECICLYLWTGFIGTWIFIDALPVKGMPIAGIACFAADYDFTSLIFFWVVFVVAFAGIPIVIIAIILIELVCVKKVIKKLAGSSKDTKGAVALAKFFGKLFVVFVLMWGPAIMGVWIFGGETLMPWLTAFGGMWSHFQGAVSAYFYTSDPDRKSVV